MIEYELRVVGEEIFVAGKDPGEEKSWIYPRRGRAGEEKSKFSSLGYVLPRQNIQIPCQKYKFLAKIHKNEPIPRHGEEKS